MRVRKKHLPARPVGQSDHVGSGHRAFSRRSGVAGGGTGGTDLPQGALHAQGRPVARPPQPFQRRLPFGVRRVEPVNQQMDFLASPHRGQLDAVDRSDTEPLQRRTEAARPIHGVVVCQSCNDHAVVREALCKIFRLQTSVAANGMAVQVDACRRCHGNGCLLAWCRLSPSRRPVTPPVSLA